MEDTKDYLIAWLSSKEGDNFLHECAQRIIGYKERYITAKQSVFWNVGKGEKERIDNLHDLKSEIFIFIFDNSNVRNKIEKDLRGGKNLSALKNLQTMYISQLKDARRGKEGDFVSYLYRKIQVFLSKHEGFTVSSQRDGSFYAAIIAEGLPVLGGEFFQNHNVEAWPSPQRPNKEATSHDYQEWAKTFWNLVRKAAGYDCLVPIRELTYYLIHHKCVGDPIAKVSSSVQRDQHGQEIDLLDDFPDQNPASGVSSQVLEGMAQDLVSSWGPKVAQAFYLRYADDLPLSEIAEKLGYAGPSGVSNLLQRAAHSLREKISAWPGLYGQEENEALSKEFLEYVLDFCKTYKFDRT